MEATSLVRVLGNHLVPTIESWQDTLPPLFLCLQMLKIVPPASSCPCFKNVKQQEWQEVMFINEA